MNLKERDAMEDELMELKKITRNEKDRLSVRRHIFLFDY